MDQCQSRGKLLTNFQHHWSMQTLPEDKGTEGLSIRISPEIHMDQWLSESSGLHYRSIDCSSLRISGKWPRATYRKDIVIVASGEFLLG